MKLQHSNPHIQFSIQLFTGFIITGAILLITYSKIEFSLIINQLSSPSFDFFFNAVTQLGLGGLLAVLAIFFLFFRYYYSILCTGILVMSGIISFLFKKVLFTDAMRPLHFMRDMPLRFPSGMEEHFRHSFPSGHTMTVFAAAFILFWIYRDYRVAIINFTVAILVGISRIYLFQHFFIDIYAGAILGIAESVFIIWLFENIFQLNQIPALNKSLIAKKRKPQLAFKNNRYAQQ
ncbi:phosphatase PAP2 family protein [Plebeiibacterium marinum]|uniref:Phosphatase PAP2 family protein n=1 Tax=Plebeiibacterium marinum TaxID=2992111 RepID=A0AAE3SLG2_9BACT|nr:phosphatase PAP2 family protein [Plebeiobacterium marinum]MCW3807667.1 phosphatase PAP2 family protein [Plebeiobacterium marinum]